VHWRQNRTKHEAALVSLDRGPDRQAGKCATARHRRLEALSAMCTILCPAKPEIDEMPVGKVLLTRILRKYDNPPDKQEKATQTVLEQAELRSAGWSAA
jgi:hypothetical protein